MPLHPGFDDRQRVGPGYTTAEGGPPPLFYGLMLAGLIVAAWFATRSLLHQP